MLLPSSTLHVLLIVIFDTNWGHKDSPSHSHRMRISRCQGVRMHTPSNQFFSVLLDTEPHLSAGEPALTDGGKKDEQLCRCQANNCNFSYLAHQVLVLRGQPLTRVGKQRAGYPFWPANHRI